MENDQRITKSLSYLDGALSDLNTPILKDFCIKKAKTRIRNAMTLLRNTKNDTRINNLEREINLIKDILAKGNK